jgi:hypothetical protein
MLNAYSIGNVKGGCHHIHNDPYLGGQQSGKQAKSDVVSSEANTHAHAEASQSVSIPAMPNMTPHFATHTFAPPSMSVPMSVPCPSTVPSHFTTHTFASPFTQPLPMHF